METKGYYKFLNQLITDPYVDSIVQGLTNKSIDVANALAGLFFVISILWNFSKTTAAGGPDMVKKQEIMRIMVLWFGIAVYPHLMGFCFSVAEEVAELYAVNETSLTEYGDYLESQHTNSTYGDVPDQVKESLNKNSYNIDNTSNNQTDAQNNNTALKSQDTGPSDAEGKQKGWTDALGMIMSPTAAISAILEALLLILAEIIRFVISMIIIIVVKVLYIVGPLAFAFSMLPMFKEKVGEWFATIINCAFCFTTFNILDSILITNVFGQAMDFGAGEGHTSGPRMILHIITIILYPMVWWLTAKYVGSDGAGKVFNSAMDTATRAGALAISGGAAAATMGTSSATNASSAAAVGQDALKKSE